MILFYFLYFFLKNIESLYYPRNTFSRQECYVHNAFGHTNKVQKKQKLPKKKTLQLPESKVVL